MSTKSRQTIYGGQIIGAKIRAESARKRAADAAREADRAEAEATLRRCPQDGRYPGGKADVTRTAHFGRE